MVKPRSTVIVRKEVKCSKNVYDLNIHAVEIEGNARFCKARFDANSGFHGKYIFSSEEGIS